jgi:hypothetical protein
MSGFLPFVIFSESLLVRVDTHYLISFLLVKQSKNELYDKEITATFF